MVMKIVTLMRSVFGAEIVALVVILLAAAVLMPAGIAFGLRLGAGRRRRAASGAAIGSPLWWWRRLCGSKYGM